MVTFTKHSKSNDGLEFWHNPIDDLIYETTGRPDNGFTNEINANPIFDASIYNSNLDAIESAKSEGTLNMNLIDSLSSPSLDPELEQALAEYSSLASSGRIREAALLSTDNSVVDIVKVEAQMYGRKDRAYSGRELMRTIATEELITNIDKILKMSGMEEIREGQMPRTKDISYERVNLQTLKYGLTIRVTDEARRKNVHNPYEDSIQVASTKEAQRKSFDVISALDSDLPVVAGVTWDDYVSGTDRSSNDPATDIMRVITSTIEKTNVGGEFTHMGIQQIGAKLYETNSFNRGIVAPASTAKFKPGTRAAVNLEDVTLVTDQFIPQGDAFLVDAGEDAAGIFLEGPATVVTDIDMLKTQTYVALSYHFASVINQDTGIKMTGVYTPLAPA